MSGSPPKDAVLSDIIDKIAARPFYRGVLVETATLRTPNGLSSSAVIAIAFDEVKQARKVHDYGSLILGEKWYSKDEFIAWLNQLTEKSKLQIDEKTEIDAKGDWIRYESAPSLFLPSDNNLAEEGWPSNLYRYYLPQGNWYPSSTLTTKISLFLYSPMERRQCNGGFMSTILQGRMFSERSTSFFQTIG